jgi:hypothetical protein
MIERCMTSQLVISDSKTMIYSPGPDWRLEFVAGDSEHGMVIFIWARNGDQGQPATAQPPQA